MLSKILFSTPHHSHSLRFVFSKKPPKKSNTQVPPKKSNIQLPLKKSNTQVPPPSKPPIQLTASQKRALQQKQQSQWSPIDLSQDNWSLFKTLFRLLVIYPLICFMCFSMYNNYVDYQPMCFTQGLPQIRLHPPSSAHSAAISAVLNNPKHPTSLPCILDQQFESVTSPLHHWIAQERLSKKTVVYYDLAIRGEEQVYKEISHMESLFEKYLRKGPITIVVDNLDVMEGRQLRQISTIALKDKEEQVQDTFSEYGFIAKMKEIHQKYEEVKIILIIRNKQYLEKIREEEDNIRKFIQRVKSRTD